MQILIKLLLTVFLFYIGYLIWKTDIDIGKFRPDRFMKSKAEKFVSQIPSRGKDAIYQNDKITARANDGKYEERSGKIYFNQLEYSNELDLQQEFEFQKYVLKIQHINTINNISSLESHKGRILQGVYCNIIRKR